MFGTSPDKTQHGDGRKRTENEWLGSYDRIISRQNAGAVCR